MNTIPLPWMIAASMLAVAATGTLAQEDPYGGSGGHFLVAQEMDRPSPEGPGRCATHFAPIGTAVEAVREANLVAPVTDPSTGELDYAAGPEGPVIGSISVCYLLQEGRERRALAVLELTSGDPTLLVEATGECSDFPTPHDPSTLFQSCSLQITGPAAEGVRSGSLSSGGLVPKAQPAESIRPNVWTLFVVRD